MTHPDAPATSARTHTDRSHTSTSVSRLRRLSGQLLQGEQPYMLYVAFAILLVVFSAASPYFLSLDNFLNIGRQTALVSIISVGMTFVIIARQIDLSVGSTLALSGMSAALAMTHLHDSWLVGAAAGIGTGAMVGLINGMLTTRLAIPSFLVTLGTLSAARGLAMLVTDTKPVIITQETYIELFGETTFFGIPAPIAWTLLATVIGVLLLHYSIYGRQVYAAGGNPTAALYSGINTQRVTTLAFVFTGMLAGLAGLVLSARSHAARPDVVQGMELDVIASVILGGCSLFGGRGFIIGTLLGSLIIGTLNNGLVLLGVSSSLQLVIKGAIIVAAVAFTRR
jgi:ribose/xylose/arabinose/galactoside ABC-type transport system permease subunit